MSKVITKHVYEFSRNNEPVERVNPGDTITFQTLDCFSNQVSSEDQLITSIDFSRVNPATGPVFIEGAEVGDVLVVDILSIDVGKQGVAATLPEVGPLAHLAEPRTRVIPIKDGIATFKDVSFPINPMIGVIGVAPKGEDVPSGMWGDHGGNMDNNKIVAGTRVYFPVNIDGALFQLGDLHATMGDGEISGTGIEIAGRVEVRVDLIKDFKINRPVHTNEEYWYTIANAKNYTEALQLATKDMSELMEKAYGWDLTDSFIYMSIQGNIEICQAATPADGDVVVRMGIPKISDKPLIK